MINEFYPKCVIGNTGEIAPGMGNDKLQQVGAPEPYRSEC